MEYSGILDNRNNGRTDPLARKAYIIWLGQRDRCGSVNHKGWKNYGAKGIRVEYSSREFVYWCLSNRNFNINSSIGRINHSKNYSLDNIEITTRSKNAAERNSRLGNPTPPIKIICHDIAADQWFFFNNIRIASQSIGFHRTAIKNQIQNRINRITGRFVFFMDNQ